MIPQSGGQDADVSLSGNLEDVPLADVLQFIHLGRRTGTLSLTREGEGAEIGFHHGQIISASSPLTKRLGKRLVEEGILAARALEQGLEVQHGQKPRESLGSVLVAQGLIDADTLRRQIETQIAETVYELVTWTRGVFRFTLDELRPVDDIGMFPGDLIPHIDLNTQMVLLEATRIFDERNRTDVRSQAAGRLLPAPPAKSPRPEPKTVPPPAATLPIPPVPPPSSGGGLAPPPASQPAPDSQPQARDVQAAAPPEVVEDSLASLLESLGTQPGRETSASAEEVEEVEPRLAEPVRLQVLTTDDALFSGLALQFEGGSARPVRIRPHEAGIGLHGETAPIVLFDLRQGTLGPQDVRALRRSRPRAPILAVVSEATSIGRVIEAGALAVVPAEPRAVASCVESILRNRFDSGTEDVRNVAARGGLARLRRILTDLRSGLLSATVALNLLHIISESVERAILFLVKDDELTALGAFGFSSEGEILAQVSRGFRLPRAGSDPLLDSVEDGQVRSVNFDEAGFSLPLIELVGRPETGQVVIFPVLGASRVISVIYADNGQTTRAIEDIELLELATAQVGMAYENELLRRRQASRDADG